MKRKLFILFFAALRLVPLTAQVAIKRNAHLMGCGFSITVVGQDSSEANRFIDTTISEIRRIEHLISSWDTHSQTYLINQNAGIAPIKVNKELYELIERSLSLSKLSDGAFDLSYASLDKVWKFDGSMKTMPSPEEIKKSVRKVGYQNILLDETKQTVFLKEKGMKIGFGAIGKGYAADQAKKLLIEKGVKAGVINASGDITTWGKKPNGKDWEVSIINPLNKQHIFASSPISEGAVVTSGDYEKYVTFNGKQYAHIINPKTGYPSTGIISATVYAPKAELADALATALFVMGIEVGIDRINQLYQVECIVIDSQGKMHASNGISFQKE